MENYQVRSAITFLKTKDLEETTRFYRQVMGFSLALDQGQCRIFQVCRSGYIGFCLTEGSTGSGEVVYTLEVDDVDAFCLAAEGRGAAVEVRPRFNEHYQIYQMFLRDPNGYCIEVQRFLDPRWPGV